MNEYLSVDPEQRYHIERLTLAERHALAVLNLYPDGRLERTRDVIQIDIQGDKGCILVLTAEAIEVRLPTTEWTGGAYGPRRSSIYKRRVSFNRSTYAELPALIAQALAEREAQFKECVYCKGVFPPEHLTGDACHGCSTEHLHLVY